LHIKTKDSNSRSVRFQIATQDESKIAWIFEATQVLRLQTQLNELFLMEENIFKWGRWLAQ